MRSKEKAGGWGGGGMEGGVYKHKQPIGRSLLRGKRKQAP